MIHWQVANQQESVTCILIPGRLLETALFSWLIFLAWAKNLNSQLIWGWRGLHQVWSKATFSHIIPAGRENTEQVGRVNQGKNCRGIFQCSCSHSREGVAWFTALPLTHAMTECMAVVTTLHKLSSLTNLKRRHLFPFKKCETMLLIQRHYLNLRHKHSWA